MRIAYVAHVNYPRSSGVVKKILNQAQLWREYGEQVGIFWLTRNPDFVSEEKGEYFFTYQGGAFSRSRLYALRSLVDEVLRWSPDIIYLRRDMVYPAYVVLSKKQPVVVEINTNDLAELWLYNKAQAVYHFLTRSLFDREVKGFIFPTRELSMDPYFAKCPGLKEVIANGIRLSTLPLLEPTSNDKPVLVFIGQPAPWQGVDKILVMARHFPDWTFHLIGVDKIQDAGPNVLFHGFLPTSEYLPIVARADVGIGPLALHRKGMNEASPLKVREYLGLGLPIIIGHEDTDFPGGAPFILQLPNREDNVAISLPQIRQFVENWRGRRVPRSVVAQIDQTVKEEKRLAFFRRVLNAYGGSR